MVFEWFLEEPEAEIVPSTTIAQFKLSLFFFSASLCCVKFCCKHVWAKYKHIIYSPKVKTGDHQGQAKRTETTVKVSEVPDGVKVQNITAVSETVPKVDEPQCEDQKPDTNPFTAVSQSKRCRIRASEVIEDLRKDDEQKFYPHTNDVKNRENAWKKDDQPLYPQARECQNLENFVKNDEQPLYPQTRDVKNWENVRKNEDQPLYPQTTECKNWENLVKIDEHLLHSQTRDVKHWPKSSFIKRNIPNVTLDSFFRAPERIVKEPDDSFWRKPRLPYMCHLELNRFSTQENERSSQNYLRNLPGSTATFNETARKKSGSPSKGKEGVAKHDRLTNISTFSSNNGFGDHNDQINHKITNEDQSLHKMQINEPRKSVMFYQTNEDTDLMNMSVSMFSREDKSKNQCSDKQSKRARIQLSPAGPSLAKRNDKLMSYRIRHKLNRKISPDGLSKQLKTHSKPFQPLHTRGGLSFNESIFDKSDLSSNKSQQSDSSLSIFDAKHTDFLKRVVTSERENILRHSGLNKRIKVSKRQSKIDDLRRTDQIKPPQKHGNGRIANENKAYNFEKMSSNKVMIDNFNDVTCLMADEIQDKMSFGHKRKPTEQTLRQTLDSGLGTGDFKRDFGKGCSKSIFGKGDKQVFGKGDYHHFPIIDDPDIQNGSHNLRNNYGLRQGDFKQVQTDSTNILKDNFLLSNSSASKSVSDCSIVPGPCFSRGLKKHKQKSKEVLSKHKITRTNVFPKKAASCSTLENVSASREKVKFDLSRECKSRKGVFSYRVSKKKETEDSSKSEKKSGSERFSKRGILIDFSEVSSSLVRRVRNLMSKSIEQLYFTPSNATDDTENALNEESLPVEKNIDLVTAQKSSVSKENTLKSENTLNTQNAANNKGVDFIKEKRPSPFHQSLAYEVHSSSNLSGFYSKVQPRPEFKEICKRDNMYKENRGRALKNVTSNKIAHSFCKRESKIPVFRGKRKKPRETSPEHIQNWAHSSPNLDKINYRNNSKAYSNSDVNIPSKINIPSLSFTPKEMKIQGKNKQTLSNSMVLSSETEIFIKHETNSPRTVLDACTSTRTVDMVLKEKEETLQVVTPTYETCMRTAEKGIQIDLNSETRKSMLQARRKIDHTVSVEHSLMFQNPMNYVQDVRGLSARGKGLENRCPRSPKLKPVSKCYNGVHGLKLPEESRTSFQIAHGNYQLKHKQGNQQPDSHSDLSIKYSQDTLDIFSNISLAKSPSIGQKSPSPEFGILIRKRKKMTLNDNFYGSKVCMAESLDSIQKEESKIDFSIPSFSYNKYESIPKPDNVKSDHVKHISSRIPVRIVKNVSPNISKNNSPCQRNFVWKKPPLESPINHISKQTPYTRSNKSPERKAFEHKENTRKRFSSVQNSEQRPKFDKGFINSEILSNISKKGQSKANNSDVKTQTQLDSVLPYLMNESTKPIIIINQTTAQSKHHSSPGSLDQSSLAKNNFNEQKSQIPDNQQKRHNVNENQMGEKQNTQFEFPASIPLNNKPRADLGRPIFRATAKRKTAQKQQPYRVRTSRDYAKQNTLGKDSRQNKCSIETLRQTQHAITKILNDASKSLLFGNECKTVYEEKPNTQLVQDAQDINNKNNQPEVIKISPKKNDKLSPISTNVTKKLSQKINVNSQIEPQPHFTKGSRQIINLDLRPLRPRTGYKRKQSSFHNVSPTAIETSKMDKAESVVVNTYSIHDDGRYPHPNLAGRKHIDLGSLRGARRFVKSPQPGYMRTTQSYNQKTVKLDTSLGVVRGNKQFKSGRSRTTKHGRNTLLTNEIISSIVAGKQINKKNYGNLTTELNRSQVLENDISSKNDATQACSFSASRTINQHLNQESRFKPFESGLRDLDTISKKDGDSHTDMTVDFSLSVSNTRSVQLSPPPKPQITKQKPPKTYFSETLTDKQMSDSFKKSLNVDKENDAKNLLQTLKTDHLSNEQTTKQIKPIKECLGDVDQLREKYLEEISLRKQSKNKVGHELGLHKDILTTKLGKSYQQPFPNSTPNLDFEKSDGDEFKGKDLSNLRFTQRRHWKKTDDHKTSLTNSNYFANANVRLQDKDNLNATVSQKSWLQTEKSDDGSELKILQHEIKTASNDNPQKLKRKDKTNSIEDTKELMSQIGAVCRIGTSSQAILERPTLEDHIKSSNPAVSIENEMRSHYGRQDTVTLTKPSKDDFEDIKVRSDHNSENYKSWHVGSDSISHGHSNDGSQMSSVEVNISWISDSIVKNTKTELTEKHNPKDSIVAARRPKFYEKYTGKKDGKKDETNEGKKDRNNDGNTDGKKDEEFPKNKHQDSKATSPGSKPIPSDNRETASFSQTQNISLYHKDKKGKKDDKAVSNMPLILENLQETSPTQKRQPNLDGDSPSIRRLDGDSPSIRRLEGDSPSLKRLDGDSPTLRRFLANYQQDNDEFLQFVRADPATRSVSKWSQQSRSKLFKPRNKSISESSEEKIKPPPTNQANNSAFFSRISDMSSNLKHNSIRRDSLGDLRCLMYEDNNVEKLNVSENIKHKRYFEGEKQLKSNTLLKDKFEQRSSTGETSSGDTIDKGKREHDTSDDATNSHISFDWYRPSSNSSSTARIDQVQQHHLPNQDSVRQHSISNEGSLKCSNQMKHNKKQGLTNDWKWDLKKQTATADRICVPLKYETEYRRQKKKAS